MTATAETCDGQLDLVAEIAALPAAYQIHVLLPDGPHLTAVEREAYAWWSEDDAHDIAHAHDLDYDLHVDWADQPDITVTVTPPHAAAREILDAYAHAGPYVEPWLAACVDQVADWHWERTRKAALAAPKPKARRKAKAAA